MKEKMMHKAIKLPRRPGCYLMLNHEDQVIYVGKAVDLRNRVVTYFNNSKKNSKTNILVKYIKDFYFILTSSESEAYVLENNLIKKYSPKYNIRMRDDKSYPYIIVDHSGPFPCLVYTRRFKRSKDIEVFGPFSVGSNISEILKIINKSFRLRDCSLRDFLSRKEPCLLYQINQCTAPCLSMISKKDYLEDLNNALDFFRGNGKRSLKILEGKMRDYAENEEFEKASFVRDSLQLLEKFLDYTKEKNVEIQELISKGQKHIDIIAFYEGEIEIDIAIFLLRNGLLIGQKNFHFSSVDVDESVEEELLSFLLQYYTKTLDETPQLILSPFEDSMRKTFQKVLDLEVEKIGKKVKVKGHLKKYESLFKLCKIQAFENQKMRMNKHESIVIGLNKLKELLGLKERPTVLECYDVAIWQGKSPTGAQIVFKEGVPDKKSYRYYHLEERPEGNNDFAMLKEVLKRRLKYGELPDVLIVDGGKGQANSFRDVLKDLNINIPVIGHAKAKVIKKNYLDESFEKTEERIFLPGRSNPYFLKKNMPLFKIMVRMRDEAHRFSRKLHHKEQNRNFFSSWLDDIKGIGPKTKKGILSHLACSLEDLSKMSTSEMMQYLKVSEKIAKKIIEYLNLKYG
jgi:excinuclease ABC subunit C